MIPSFVSQPLGISHWLLCVCITMPFWLTKNPKKQRSILSNNQITSRISCSWDSTTRDTQWLKRAAMLRFPPLLRKWERTIQNTQNPPSTSVATSQKNTDIASSPSLGPSTDLFKGPASCFHHNQTVYSVNNAERNRNNQYFEGIHQPFIDCGKRTLCMPNHWLQRCPCVTERVIITPPCDVQAFTVLAGEGENGRVLWCTLSRVSSEGCCEQQKRWQCRWKCLSLKKELGKKKWIK